MQLIAGGGERPDFLLTAQQLLSASSPPTLLTHPACMPPPSLSQVGESDPDIFFTDRPRDVFPGQRNRECISFFADEEPGLLRGRSPMQCYVEFMR